jgi:hypothetical protein
MPGGRDAGKAPKPNKNQVQTQIQPPIAEPIKKPPWQKDKPIPKGVSKSYLYNILKQRSW